MIPIMAYSFDNSNSIVDGKNNDKTTCTNELSNENNVVVANAATMSVNTNPATKNITVNNVTIKKKVVKPTKLSQAKIISASSYVNNYVNNYKKLPKYVKIEGYKFSMPEYMYLVSKTISLKNQKKNSTVVVKYNIKNPSSPNGNNIKGTLTKKQYSNYSDNVANFLTRYNTAPNYINTKFGRMQYQTVVYGLNRALVSIEKSKDKLPNNLKLNIPRSHKMNKVVPNYFNPNSIDTSNYDIIAPPKCGEEFTIAIAKTIFAPIDVKYNSRYLISTARCSCGKKGDYSYYSAAFINYCPYCKIHGSMSYFADNRICPEGMWFCLRCDSDYCLVTGKEHVIRRPMQLKVVNF